MRKFISKVFVLILLYSISFVLFADEINNIQVNEKSVEIESSIVENNSSFDNDVENLVLNNESTNEYGNLSENCPLYFGNPSDATPSEDSGINFLMEKKQYSLSYNNQSFCANWVAWHLDVDDLGDSGRANNFRADSEIPKSWYRIKKADYQFVKYGFDRGHLCPSADRTKTEEDNEMTFLMTNMVPQSPDCNRIVWKDLEEYERDLANQNNELYIFAGPSGCGGIGTKGQFEYIPVLLSDGKEIRINIPQYTWKIILILPKGEDDISRVDVDTKIIAVKIPNEQGCQNELSWKNYLVTVDEIEQITGFDFFELLPDEIENIIESRK